MSGLFKMEKNVYSKWSDEWSANKTMIKIADIKELKLNITWKLLYRGLLEKQISINEIIEYAKEQLEKGDDRIEICELAGSSDYDLEDVMDTLYELAKEEKNPDDLEDRKLRAARVNKFLKDNQWRWLYFPMAKAVPQRRIHPKWH